MVFYSPAWTGWFALLTGGDFAHFFEFLIQAWSLGAWGRQVTSPGACTCIA